MDPVQIAWDSAVVKPAPDGFRLQVQFSAPAPHFWWNAFGAALERSDREEASGWHSIRALDDPPRGLEVNGIDDRATERLREFLNRKVAEANSEAMRAEDGRIVQARRAQAREGERINTAERLTESFRSGS